MYYQTRMTRKEQKIGRSLFVLWVIGLVCGGVCAFSFLENWETMLEEAAGCGVRWTGALCVTLFPMLISFAAVLLLGRGVIWLLCPVRSFLIGIASGAIGLCWGEQALIMAGLLLFSALLSSSVLMMMWNRLLCADSRELKAEVLVLTGLQFLIAATDTWIVSPFLVEVVNF